MAEPPFVIEYTATETGIGLRLLNWLKGLRSWHIFLMIMCVVVLLVCVGVYIVGSLPVRGLVMVDVHESHRLERILKNNGMFLWTGMGHLGAMEVAFDNPIALCTIDDQVLQDARVNKYWCRIRYECVIPYFNYERGEN